MTCWRRLQLEDKLFVLWIVSLCVAPFVGFLIGELCAEMMGIEDRFRPAQFLRS